jgi:glycosyltransferase involved in cell wall biosynthesis
MKPVGKCDVSCVVLTKNEEINLPRCLASVAWCDRVVVVDSGSTDRTLEVAGALGASTLTNIQVGAFDIAKQRNWALENAGLNSKWVLFLDADEEVTAELKRAILEASSAENELNSYQLTPKYLFWGQWLRRTQGYPNWHPRLLRLGQVSFTGGVWEHFDSRSKCGFIHEPYNHYANSKGLSDWLARHDRYSTWDAIKIADYLENKDPAALGTDRKIRLRTLAARLYPLRPPARFINTYVLRLGFLEGLPALVFCGLYFFYEFITVVKVVEQRRTRARLPL